MTFRFSAEKVVQWQTNCKDGIKTAIDYGLLGFFWRKFSISELSLIFISSYLFPLTTSKASKTQHSSLYKDSSFGKPYYFLKTKRHPTPLLLLYFKNNSVSVVWYYLNNSQSCPVSFTWILPIADPILEQASAKDTLVWCSNRKNTKDRNTDKKSQTDLLPLRNQPAR